MKTINAGIVGVGFIGRAHIEGLLRLGNIRIIAVSDANEQIAKSCAVRYGIPKVYKNFDDLIEDPEIEVIHNCTPNYLHKDINISAMTHNKHIFSEKPLGLSSSESIEMLETLEEHPDVVAGLNFCYRMNPLVQDAKIRIAKGEIGRPLLIHGSYLQDWMLFETDYNWRVDSSLGGASRTVSDIGSHWMDLAQTMIGSKIVEVLAETFIAHHVRKKPNRPISTFAIANEAEYEDVPIDTEDYAGVLLRFDNGAVGTFLCSQISAGRKCYIDIEINGTEASFQWQHQDGDSMWKGYRDKNNENILRNPLLMTQEAISFTSLAAGHPEGWNDTFKNNLNMFYDSIRCGTDSEELFATFQDGHYLIQITEAILESAKRGCWIAVGDAPHFGAYDHSTYHI